MTKSVEQSEEQSGKGWRPGPWTWSFVVAAAVTWWLFGDAFDPKTQREWEAELAKYVFVAEPALACESVDLVMTGESVSPNARCVLLKEGAALELVRSVPNGAVEVVVDPSGKRLRMYMRGDVPVR